MSLPPLRRKGLRKKQKIYFKVKKKKKKISWLLLLCLWRVLAGSSPGSEQTGFPKRPFLHVVASMLSPAEEEPAGLGSRWWQGREHMLPFLLPASLWLRDRTCWGSTQVGQPKSSCSHSPFGGSRPWVPPPLHTNAKCVGHRKEVTPASRSGKCFLDPFSLLVSCVVTCKTIQSPEKPEKPLGIC